MLGCKIAISISSFVSVFLIYIKIEKIIGVIIKKANDEAFNIIFFVFF